MGLLECECGQKLTTPTCGRTVVCDCSRSYRCMIDIPQLATRVIVADQTNRALQRQIEHLRIRVAELEPKPR